jgi:ribosomal protein S18 acetylase RimI-like enzyme
MKVLLRKTSREDLNAIYNLHLECFKPIDVWYKSYLANFMNSGYVIENIENIENSELIILGVLLYGNITACDENETIILYGNGKNFINKPMRGITMLCVNKNYQCKGLATKLIDKYHNDNPNQTLCLHTRESNINAISLYEKKGYKICGKIKDKYYFPIENSLYMLFSG